MYRFVWDTSAIINIKSPNSDGYSPGYSLYKDFNDGLIDAPYQNIFPTLAVFEINATVSRIHREGKAMLREFYLLGENAVIYDMDQNLVQKSADLVAAEGFNELRGADLVFACIAAIEDAYLVTLDRAFKKKVGGRIKVLDLNESIDHPIYREEFCA